MSLYFDFLDYAIFSSFQRGHGYAQRNVLGYLEPNDQDPIYIKLIRIPAPSFQVWEQL